MIKEKVNNKNKERKKKKLDIKNKNRLKFTNKSKYYMIKFKPPNTKIKLNPNNNSKVRNHKRVILINRRRKNLRFGAQNVEKVME